MRHFTALNVDWSYVGPDRLLYLIQIKTLLAGRKNKGTSNKFATVVLNFSIADCALRDMDGKSANRGLDNCQDN